MSFGFGIGDFVTALNLVKQVRQDWVDAPLEYASIREETRNLDNALREVNDYSARVDLTAQQKQHLTDASITCRNVLEELDALVKKNVALQKHTGPSNSLLRRKWRQFRLDPNEIRHLRERLVSGVTLLNVVSDSIQRHLIEDVRDGVGELWHSAEERERDAVADWFAPANFAEQHYDYLSQRHAGTNTWFLKDKAFLKWRDTPNHSLLCPGIPGSGKTILSASVIDHLWQHFANNEDTVVTYFYYSFKRQSEQKLDQMLASIARQLFQERPSLPEPVRKLYKQHRDRATRPSIEEIKALIPLLTHFYARVFVVIDALDECSNDDARLNTFLEQLFILQSGSKGNLSLMATSRPIPKILDVFPKATPRMEIRARPSDIERYLDGRMSEMSSNVRRNQSLQDEIKTGISRLVDGMFLLARLHFEALRDKTTPRAIRNALTDLPRGLQGLSIAYDGALQRIDHQQEGFRTLARAVLMWITYARTELTIRQLQEAMAIQPGMRAIDIENDLEDKDEMIGSCAGLVVLDSERRVLRLVHYTAQEYLEQVRDQWLPNSQSTITEKCIAYLSMDLFAMDLRLDETYIRQIRGTQVFLDYAAKTWGFHARESEDEQVEQQCLEFLAKNPLLQFVNQIRQTDRYGDFSGSGNISMLHLPALYNLQRISVKLVEAGVVCDWPDSAGRTPLSYAAEAGHKEIVDLLLMQGSVVADSADDNGRTPLAWAAGSGSDTVLQLLLERQDVNADSRDVKGMSPLAWASLAGHVACVSTLLLRKDVEIDSKDREQSTPLIHAIYQKRTEVAKVLIEQPDVNVNTVSNVGLSPLNGAIALNDTEVIKALLARKDLEINIRNYYGETPLYRATFNGNLEIVRILLARDGVRVDVKDIQGRTPIFWACLRGHTEILEMLLARAEISQPTNNDSTKLPSTETPSQSDLHSETHRTDQESIMRDMRDALLPVVSRDERRVVEILLPYRGKEEKRDEDKRTALGIAAYRGRAEITKMLLQDGFDVNVRDNNGLTPLQLAEQNGHKEIVDILRAHVSQ